MPSSRCRPRITTRRITDPGSLAAMAGDWESLLTRSHADSIFLTPEWTNAWLKAFGQGCRLLALRIERDDDLIGLALLAWQSRKTGRFGPRQCLAFAADGSTDSEYLDIIAARGEEETVVEATLDACASEIEGWTVVCLSEIPDTSPTVGVTREWAKKHGWFCDETPLPCAFVRLPATWDDYLAQLKPRMRTKVRSLLKQFDNESAYAFDCCESPDDLQPRLESLFVLHARRWRQKGQTGVFVDERRRLFYQLLSPELLRRGWLRFFALRAESGFVAHQFCFERNGTLFLLQEGFDVDKAHAGVGNMLRACVFRDAIERGVAVYDFLGGVTPHKLSWNAEVKFSVRVTLAPPGARNAAYFTARRSVRWARRNLLPLFGK